MNSKKINKLIAISYKGDSLDQKKVNKIASLMSKSDLKKYINGLKLKEKKNNVVISSPLKNNHDLRYFARLFPHKQILFKKDPSLMLGIQVIDNDLVYDFTLKNTLDKIINYVEQNYD